MKKLLVLLLLMVSTSVFAEWTEVGRNKKQTAYVDFGTIKKKGNKVKMWSLDDFNTIQKLENYRYMSSLGNYEYDCEEETVRMLDLHWYSGNMGQGEIVYSEKNIKGETVSIVPRSIDEGLFKIACGKK